MQVSPIKLEEATAEQRRVYAAKFLNLDLEGMENDEEVLSLIRSAQPGNPNIFVEDAPQQIERQVPEPDKDEVLERQAGSLGRQDPRAVIRIIPMEKDGKQINDDVPVGVNGIVWQLKRGVDLNVPWRVVEALGVAITDIVRHSEQGDVEVTTAQRIPVTIIQHPTPEEIEAWHKATDGKFCP